MKTRLPKNLLIALMSTMLCATTIASAANVAEVDDRAKDYTGTPSYPSPVIVPPTYIGTDTSVIKEELQKTSTYDADPKPSSIYLRPVVYDVKGNLSNSDAIISGYGELGAPITIKTSLYVREGMLTIKDSVIESDLSAGQYYANNYYPGLYQPAFQVSGKNATLIFDGVSFTSAVTSGGEMKKETDMICVAGRDGAGTMIITGGSDIHVGTSLLVGSQKFTGAYGGSSLATRNECTDTTGRYEGEYVDEDGDGIPDEQGAYNANCSNKILSKGIFIMDGGSKLELGGGVNIGESEFILSGKGTVMTTCTQLVNGPSTEEEGLDLIARVTSGSSAVVRIEKGAQWYSNSSLLTSAYDGLETKASITVDGEGSLISVKNELNLGWGSKKGSPEHSGSGGVVVGSTELYITNGGKVSAGSIIFGVPKDRGGANPVYVGIDASSELMSEGNMAVYSSFGADSRTQDIFAGKEIPTDFECVVHNEGKIRGNNFTLDGGKVYNSGTIDLTGTMTLKSGEMVLGLKGIHTEKAAITTGDVIVATADNADYVIQLTAVENLKAGKYLLLETAADTSDVTGSEGKSRAAEAKVVFSGLEGVNGMRTQVDEDGDVYFVLDEQLMLWRDPLADAVQAANWGVYKSSQAFSSLLWAPRPNAVVVKSVEKPTPDGKGSIMTTEVEGRTLAWGSVYSSFSRNSSSGAFAGAEYSIFGGAIGVERQFACGSSIGAAFGYDWGKVSPFSTSRVDQESWHAALYGRAAEWKPGQKSSVALDWSAAVGSTTSEHKALGSDWTQENIQLDARATYTYALTERTALSAFVGAQYYAQNDDSTERVEADSLQNLRLMVGGGISHKLTEKTTLFGEAMLFNDTMRHNPDVSLDGFEYGTGANPGRLGGSVTAGAQYQLTSDWTLRGSYSYEGADNSNEHRVNVGAVYSF